MLREKTGTITVSLTTTPSITVWAPGAMLWPL